MDSEAIWAIVLTLYILSGIFVLSEQSIGPRPKNLISGSSKGQEWDQMDKKAIRLGLGWAAGLVALLIGWSIFS